MRSPLKKILTSALVAVSAFVSVVYVSCNSDKCKTIVCAYGGVCNQGSCICPAGYEGTNCETISRDKFTAGWEVFEKGSETNAAQYATYITPDTAITGVLIHNFYNFFTSPIRAYISHDSMIIPNQQLEGKIVFGVGYIYTDNTYTQYGVMTVRYEVEDTATKQVNDFGYYPADLSNPSQWSKQP